MGGDGVVGANPAHIHIFGGHVGGKNPRYPLPEGDILYSNLGAHNHAEPWIHGVEFETF